METVWEWSAVCVDLLHKTTMISNQSTTEIKHNLFKTCLDPIFTVYPDRNYKKTLQIGKQTNICLRFIVFEDQTFSDLK